MAKMIKLFPAPHLEIRIHVSDQMIADMKEHRRLAQIPGGDGPDCDKCSWFGIGIGCMDICELPEVLEKVLEED